MAMNGDGAAWSEEFAALLAQLGPRFGRVEPGRRVAAYLKGLLAPVERKNGWQLAETAGDRTPGGVQEFLSRVRWDAVRDDLRTSVAEYLGDRGAVLVLDETGFSKRAVYGMLGQTPCPDRSCWAARIPKLYLEICCPTM